jgi:hypothetical protein
MTEYQKDHRDTLYHGPTSNFPPVQAAREHTTIHMDEFGLYVVDEFGLYVNVEPAHLPTEPQARKNMPIARGVLNYFPAAIAAVAEVSRVGNEQHNPGEPMHWARSKSDDHADCIARHLIDAGKLDNDGLRHTAKLAWRALALLQLELEAAATVKE